MRSAVFWAIVIGAILFAVGSGFLIYYKVIISEIYSYDMHLTVSSSMGVDVGTDAIYFGEIKPGNGVSKTIVIKNNKYQRAVDIVAEGNITPFLQFERRIVLEPGEDRNLTITADIPHYTGLGDYGGTLKLYFYR